jgi:hypothetical protein
MNDQKVRRADTAKGLVSILQKLRDALDMMNHGTSKDKEQNFFLTYNGTIYIHDICERLRGAVYSTLTIEFVAFCITCLESNLVLFGVKYLDWRIKLYIELAHIYEECDSLQSASKTIDAAMQKVNELREIEESDPPLPDHSRKIINLNMRALKILDLKFKLQVKPFSLFVY